MNILHLLWIIPTVVITESAAIIQIMKRSGKNGRRTGKK